MKNATNRPSVFQEHRIVIFLSLFILCSLVLAPILSAPIYSQDQVETQDDLAQSPESPAATSGIWITRAEIMRLPTTGDAWKQVEGVANKSAGTPDLSNQDDDTNVIILAKALAFVRTSNSSYRDDVVAALDVVTYNNTESGGRTLALGRELAAYVIAADLIDLATYDSSLDADFRVKIRDLLTKTLDGNTLVETHEVRPNNWGTHAGASRAAVAAYLGDTAELERTAQVFHGWVGDRSAYSDFSYGDLSWQCDSSKPVGINPKGCMKSGHSIDGALPEEMRRGGSFTWPPGKTGYAWEGLQGALVQAEILHRAGYDTWNWEDQALLRAVQFLYSIGWDATGDDEWQLWLINFSYGTEYAANAPVSAGKNMGWTDWSHSDGPVAISFLIDRGANLNQAPMTLAMVISLGIVAITILLLIQVRRKRKPA